MPSSTSPSTPVRVPRSRLKALQRALLDWFEHHGRDLPWRQTRDPYRVLVSEVMLQQIQVVRAIPFYHAFLDRFPTVHDLAAAPLAEAIRVWGDLGRYRRVVYLHRAAGIIVEQHAGRVPRDVAALKALPGVGPYTAGAVACFAYGDDTAFIDTNMRRVLHRVLVGPDGSDPSVKDTDLLGLAQQALPRGESWSWNSALMDLGATVCTARRPACDRCPLVRWCRSAGRIAIRDRARGASRPSEVPRYEETNRFARGKVLAQLRDMPDAPDVESGIDLSTLGAGVRESFDATELPWLYEVVRGLAKDGLATIADERASYDAEPDEDLTRIRVRLP